MKATEKALSPFATNVINIDNRLSPQHNIQHYCKFITVVTETVNERLSTVYAQATSCKNKLLVTASVSITHKWGQFSGGRSWV